MVVEVGSTFARTFATARWGLPRNPADREASDLYNNEVGRRVATDNPDAGPEELAGLVKKAVEQGDLLVIDGNNELAFSNEVRVGEHGLADDPPGKGGQRAEPADSGDAARGTGS